MPELINPHAYVNPNGVLCRDFQFMSWAVTYPVEGIFATKIDSPLLATIASSGDNVTVIYNGKGSYLRLDYLAPKLLK